MYLVLKNAHIVFITISIILFNYRFLLKIFKKSIPKLIKILPHINDTFLLISGISMAYLVNFNPFEKPWLMAKIIALVLYIGFGMMALKKDGLQSVIGYILATLMIVFMIFTAINKAPFLLIN
jgi:uncharacterized membrane protein SirB2